MNAADYFAVTSSDTKPRLLKSSTSMLFADCFFYAFPLAAAATLTLSALSISSSILDMFAMKRYEFPNRFFTNESETSWVRTYLMSFSIVVRFILSE